jgi:hypothetical protein
MSFNSFLEITPKEFYAALKDRNEYDGELVEANVKMICDTLRIQTKYLMNIQIPKRKDRVKNEKLLMQFPWDIKNNSPKYQTKEEMIATAKQMAGISTKKK